MTKSRFDILYESILTEMGDIHNSILKIYNWDNNKKDFSDLYNERINFIFSRGNKLESELLKDLTYDIDQCEEHNLEDGVYKKVEIFDKETGDLLISFITDNKHLNEAIEIFNYDSKY